MSNHKKISDLLRQIIGELKISNDVAITSACRTGGEIHHVDLEEMLGRVRLCREEHEPKPEEHGVYRNANGDVIGRVLAANDFSPEMARGLADRVFGRGHVYNPETGFVTMGDRSSDVGDR